MFISSDFLAYVGRKKIDRVNRAPVEATWESTPGDRQRPAPPIERDRSQKANQTEEVEYLNARNSTLDVVL
ncbi:MAG: hypothetical protein LBT86_03085 [Deltaproteobacteria bacterium]|jgi:hypothetical protein|nr:hypothetical protein [Deltaproteobacteria bacterium]